MLDQLVQRVGLPVYERLSGRRPWSEAQRLRRLQWCSPDELQARAEARLRAIVLHAAGEVPYYRALFDQAGLDPARVRTVDDLGQLPISTKPMLRAAYPDGVLAGSIPSVRRLYRRTSGSTGTPFEFFADRADLDSWVGSYLF